VSEAPTRIDLALQGGGSHAAFTRGVLDRLLEEDGLEIVGIAGTSAGAVNAVVLASGLLAGGREEARRALDRFWGAVAAAGMWSPLKPSPLDRVLSEGDMDTSPAWLWADALSRLLSPYQLNPLGYHPLRAILEEQVDFAALRAQERIRLFLAATDVGRCALEVFDNPRLSVDAVLASACLPFLFQAVEIEGRAYWDGGYMGNPPLEPLIDGTDCDDFVIVQINPIWIEAVPTRAAEILDRMNEVAFNSSLVRELRTIARINDFLAEGRLPPERYRRLRLHMIGPEPAMARLGYSSKLNTERDFLLRLKALGRARAGAFLGAHRADLGRRSTLELARFR
jgi:NTE family protein